MNTQVTTSQVVILQHVTSGEKYAVKFAADGTKVVMASDALHYGEITEILKTGEFNDLPEMTDAISANLKDYQTVQVREYDANNFDLTIRPVIDHRDGELADDTFMVETGLEASQVEIVVFTHSEYVQLETSAGYGNYWQDNGDECDGSSYVADYDTVCDGSEITIPEDSSVIMPPVQTGWLITGYTSAMESMFREFMCLNRAWCAWSSSGVALLSSLVTANEIPELLIAMYAIKSEK